MRRKTSDVCHPVIVTHLDCRDRTRRPAGQQLIYAHDSCTATKTLAALARVVNMLGVRNYYERSHTFECSQSSLRLASFDLALQHRTHRKPQTLSDRGRSSNRRMLIHKMHSSEIGTARRTVFHRAVSGSEGDDNLASCDLIIAHHGRLDTRSTLFG